METKKGEYGHLLPLSIVYDYLGSRDKKWVVFLNPDENFLGEKIIETGYIEGFDENKLLMLSYGLGKRLNEVVDLADDIVGKVYSCFLREIYRPDIN